MTYISGGRKEGFGLTSRAALAASALVAVATAVGAAAGPTLAAAKSHHRPSCPQRTFVKPFRAFGDSKSYFLVPGSNFATSVSGWTFAGGAQVVSDPLSPSGYAALIPPGGSITSPRICIMKHEPTSRAFGATEKLAGHTQGNLGVTIINDRTGKSKFVGHVPLLRKWGPTRKMTLASGWLRLSRRVNHIQYRFAVAGKASWELADFYVDPRMSH